MSLRKKKNRGQTTLEYFLVIGVIAVGAIAVAKSFFQPKGAVQELMSTAIQEARDTIK